MKTKPETRGEAIVRESRESMTLPKPAHAAPRYLSDAERAEIDARVACYADKSVGMMLPVREVESLCATVAALLDGIESPCKWHHLPLTDNGLHVVTEPLGKRNVRCEVPGKLRALAAQIRSGK